MKIAVLLSRIPYPLEKGDKLRAYYQIRELSKWHDIYLIALYHKDIPQDAFRELTPFCRKIHFLKQNPLRSALNMAGTFFKGLPIQCGYFYSHKNHKEIDKIIRDIRPDRIYCQLFRMAEYVRNSQITKILDYQDAFSKGMERRAEKAVFPIRQIMKSEAQKIAKYETEIFDDFDARTIITAVDRDLIQHPMKHEIVVIPNGVDFAKFRNNDIEKSYDLIFSGNMNYPPNIDAAVYLCTEILPELRKSHPDIRVMIAGANPAAKVRALQNRNVSVTGWVPSMAECYAKTRIFIAPMRLGTGLQNKLLEAMAMKLPCVTSPLAAKAMHPDKNAIIQCSTTGQYVENIQKLLEDDTYYRTFAENGNRFVHEHYDWTAATQILNDVITLRNK